MRAGQGPPRGDRLAGPQPGSAAPAIRPGLRVEIDEEPAGVLADRGARPSGHEAEELRGGHRRIDVGEAVRTQPDHGRRRRVRHRAGETREQPVEAALGDRVDVGVAVREVVERSGMAHARQAGDTADRHGICAALFEKAEARGDARLPSAV